MVTENIYHWKSIFKDILIYYLIHFDKKILHNYPTGMTHKFYITMQ